jgi:tetratricopeptide (TPR) repeat protein
MIYAPKTLSENTVNTWLYSDNLIRKGLYEQADKVIEGLLAKNFSETENHEFLLMQGKVKGYLLQHEFAKNLLFTAFEFFRENNNKEKTIECLNHLAITCLRNGEIKEAKAFLNSVRPLKDEFSIVVEQMVLLDAKDNKAVIELSIPKNADSFITANFHNNLAIAYQQSKQIDIAIENYQIAYDFFVLCEHFAYSGSVQNNLANTYLDQNNFGQAHFYVDKALEIFKECENHGRFASALDTKANIYFIEKKYVVALEFIDESIRILNTYQNNFYLLESYETKIKICFAAGDYEAALQTFSTGILLAKTYCGEDWTNKFIERIANIIPKLDCNKPAGVFLQQELSKLEDVENKGFVFPEDYESGGRHFIVETTNSQLYEQFGIERNTLLVVADIFVENGDLIAGLIKKTQSVIVGTFRHEFGVTALEIPGYMPIFLDEKHNILGKIIGIGEVENEQIIVKVFD